MADLRYQADYAKSGRESCKGCKKIIKFRSLRLAIMVQTGYLSGKQANWHHEGCFFKKCRVQSIAEIANFNKLRTADKERIRKTIESNTGIVLPVEGKGKKGKRAAADISSPAVKDFAVEYATSNHSLCQYCKVNICKDEVRICKIMYDTDVGMKYGGQPFWHHVKCFEMEQDNLGYLAGGEHLPGFNNLSADDQKMVKEAIKSVNEVPVKKTKTEPKNEEDIKKAEDLKKVLDKQNKLIQEHRRALTEFSDKELCKLLIENIMELPVAYEKGLDRLADAMAFGAPVRCPECKGEIVPDTFNYKCKGSISEWSRCPYTTTDPKRKLFAVPHDSIFTRSSAFHNYQPKIAKREFEAAPPPPVVKQDGPAEKENVPIPPLKNLQFFLQGLFKSNQEKVKTRVLKLGGLVVSKLTNTTAAVISNKKEVQKLGIKMREIQKKDIEVVEESFLNLIDPENGTIANTLELIKLHNIAPWGSDPAKRVPQDVNDGKSIATSKSLYEKSSKSTTTKFKIKGGSEVDPDSLLADVAHVYTDRDGCKYTVVLCKTDVVAQRNSYYKLQLLEADNENKYWVFRSKGRIGTTIGINKKYEFKSLDDAIKRFEDYYFEKTENRWESRDSFMKAPDRYFPIDLDYGEEQFKALTMDKSSKLPEPLQKLVMLMFDTDIMKKMLLEFELDTEEMPLGKLSKNQIKSGYKVLSKLLEDIENGRASQNTIIDATNRFYTTVPHDFGVNNPPLLDNVDIIKKKSEMLDRLLEIEIAYNFIETDEQDTHSPLDQHYLKLKCDIAPLSTDCREFHIIAKYFVNTHAPTHTNYTLEIEQVFEVVREGEAERFKQFRKWAHRRLLWHGSRDNNFAGILSQGLRIAPPEVSSNGCMFGKGIYFADMVSKSANYCKTNKNNPCGILLLCEVALGKMKYCFEAEMITQLPDGFRSTYGVGRTQPDYNDYRLLKDGTIVPIGKPIVHHNIKTSLRYNEFVVYDVAQVNIRYLLQLKFNHKD